MSTKDLKVASDEQALKLMLSFLAANMLDNELSVENPNDSEPKYVIRYGWFSRDEDAEDKVGCPCYVADYEGYIPGEDRAEHAIVYVKSFAQRYPTMTKMHLVKNGGFDFIEIENGEEFVMEDGRRYLRQDGKVMPIN
ncbi:MAG: hypothetical protein KHX55_03460 [Proteobacteria bacterium]|nr:hypothetical protein [Pseudomonadota bacterium]